MKASLLIKHLQSQIEQYGDQDVRICTINFKSKNIRAVTSDFFDEVIDIVTQ